MAETTNWDTGQNSQEDMDLIEQLERRYSEARIQARILAKQDIDRELSKIREKRVAESEQDRIERLTSRKLRILHIFGIKS